MVLPFPIQSHSTQYLLRPVTVAYSHTAIDSARSRPVVAHTYPAQAKPLLSPYSCQSRTGVRGPCSPIIVTQFLDNVNYTNKSEHTPCPHGHMFDCTQSLLAGPVSCHYYLLLNYSHKPLLCWTTHRPIPGHRYALHKPATSLVWLLQAQSPVITFEYTQACRHHSHFIRSTSACSYHITTIPGILNLCRGQGT